MLVGGIALAIIANMIIGALYYSPVFALNLWKKLIPKKQKDGNPDGMIVLLLGSAIMSFISAVVLVILMPQFEISSVAQSALFGFLLWLGFSMPAIAVNNMYQQNPWLLTVVDAGYQLLGIVTMSVILYLFI